MDSGAGAGGWRVEGGVDGGENKEKMMKNVLELGGPWYPKILVISDLFQWFLYFGVNLFTKANLYIFI